jgi:hypothetical protein
MCGGNVKGDCRVCMMLILSAFLCGIDLLYPLHNVFRYITRFLVSCLCRWEHMRKGTIQVLSVRKE